MVREKKYRVTCWNVKYSALEQSRKKKLKYKYKED